jgi:hypothetical protein
VSGLRWAGKLAGPRGWWWAAAGAGPKREKVGRVEREGFLFIFQTHSNNEFKPEFEFKHNKVMYQHVCNRELLYFIL